MWRPKFVSKLPPLTWAWLRVEQEQGDRLPPWWYALGRVAYDADIAYFYPLPLAWLIMAYDWVGRWWNRLRSRTSAYDTRAMLIRRRAERLGYRRGYHFGVDHHTRMLLDELSKLRK